MNMRQNNKKDINVENSFYMKFIIKIDLEKRKTLHQQLTLGVFLLQNLGEIGSRHPFFSCQLVVGIKNTSLYR